MKLLNTIKHLLEEDEVALNQTVDGKKDGFWRTYWGTGKFVAEEGMWWDGRPVGKHVKYHSNGSLRLEMFFDNNSKAQGPKKVWNEHGQLISLENYKDGRLDGTQIAYYGYGYKGPFTIRNYKNGLMNGDYESYFSNGTLEKKGQYKNERREGLWIEYFDDGRIASKGKYVNNKQEGRWIHYDKIHKLPKYIDDRFEPSKPLYRKTSSIYKDDNLVSQIESYVDEI